MDHMMTGLWSDCLGSSWILVGNGSNPMQEAGVTDAAPYVTWANPAVGSHDAERLPIHSETLCPVPMLHIRSIEERNKVQYM